MSNRELKKLIVDQDPAINLLKEWVRDANVPCELLPPGPERENTLLYLEVTTHSTLGAFAYDTGGLIIDDGWLRFLGSGHEKLQRGLHDWNSTRTDKSFLLVGDDAAGGLFAINGGAFGDDMGSVYYWAPDSLEWESLNAGFTDIVTAFLSDYLGDFYKSLRWPTWREDIRQLSNDQCFFFYPFLWTKEGSLENSQRSIVSMNELWDWKVDVVRQMS